MHQPKHIPDELFQGAWPAVRAGKTGVPEVIVDGGVKASAGKIVFTGNLVAGDTVTVGNVVFTAVTSGATGNQFNVDSTLALSLASLAAALNASTDPRVSVSTYSVTDTNTAITSTLDSYGVGPSLASSHSTVVVTPHANGKAAVYASVDTEHTQINFPTAFTADIILPDGDETQRKTIANLGSGTANIVSLGSKLPGSTVNYAMNGNDVLVLQWLGGKWRLILNDGAVAS